MSQTTAQAWPSTPQAAGPRGPLPSKSTRRLPAETMCPIATRKLPMAIWARRSPPAWPRSRVPRRVAVIGETTISADALCVLMTWRHATAGAGWWCRLSEHVGIIMSGCNSGVGGLYIYQSAGPHSARDAHMGDGICTNSAGHGVGGYQICNVIMQCNAMQYASSALHTTFFLEGIVYLIPRLE